jgi:DNA-binding transcriptional LysR family regulator
VGVPAGQRRNRDQLERAVLLNDIASLHAVGLAGYGIGQLLEPGIESLIENGRLEVIFPDWLDEQFPLYALHPSRRHHPRPKTRAFLDFVIATVKSRSARPH